MPDIKMWKTPQDTGEIRPLQSKETDANEAGLTATFPLIGTDGQVYGVKEIGPIQYNDPNLTDPQRNQLKAIALAIAKIRGFLP